MKSKKTDIGTIRGLEISVITDAAGSDIVVSKKGKTLYLSHCKTHSDGVKLAKRAMKEGTSIIKNRRGPMSSFEELVLSFYIGSFRS